MNYFLWFTLKGVNKPQSVYLKKLLDTMDEPGTNDIKKKLIWPWSRVEHGQSGNNSPWFICAIIVLLSANLHRFEVFFIINYNTSTWSDWSNYRQEWDLLRSLKKNTSRLRYLTVPNYFRSIGTKIPIPILDRSKSWQEYLNGMIWFDLCSRHCLDREHILGWVTFLVFPLEGLRPHLALKWRH